MIDVSERFFIFELSRTDTPSYLSSHVSILCTVVLLKRAHQKDVSCDTSYMQIKLPYQSLQPNFCGFCFRVIGSEKNSGNNRCGLLCAIFKYIKNIFHNNLICYIMQNMFNFLLIIFLYFLFDILKNKTLILNQWKRTFTSNVRREVPDIKVAVNFVYSWNDAHVTAILWLFVVIF